MVVMVFVRVATVPLTFDERCKWLVDMNPRKMISTKGFPSRIHTIHMIEFKVH